MAWSAAWWVGGETLGQSLSLVTAPIKADKSAQCSAKRMDNNFLNTGCRNVQGEVIRVI